MTFFAAKFVSNSERYVCVGLSTIAMLVLVVYAFAATPAAMLAVFMDAAKLMDAATFWGIDRGLAPVGLGPFNAEEVPMAFSV